MLWFISTFLPYLVSSLALLPNYEMKGAAYELRHAPKPKTSVLCHSMCLAHMVHVVEEVDIQSNKTRFVQRLSFNPIFRMPYVCSFSCTALA